MVCRLIELIIHQNTERKTNSNLLLSYRSCLAGKKIILKENLSKDIIGDRMYCVFRLRVFFEGLLLCEKMGGFLGTTALQLIIKLSLKIVAIKNQDS